MPRTAVNQKGPLNLTVEKEFKKKAGRLARERRRSISGLFEDLIEEEEERRRRQNENRQNESSP
jgi:hypothetical protein